MIFLNAFLYYTLFASAILIYGVGLNRIADISLNSLNDVTFLLKAIISIFSTSILSWVVTYYILQPIKLVELCPLVIFVIYVCVNTFLEALIRITTGKSSVEFVVTYLIILLSVVESYSVLNTIIICVSCMLAFVILIPFCITFKARITMNGQSIDKKYYSIFFIFLSMLILVVSVWDIIWFSAGVIR